ncbi:DUF4834 family protein [Namhaeicola litoreus]|uniref:DUF4834 family protein n=1 Tax=Namhaeicola litoreus TaxID=1052145 RepID=A0ABW3Y3I9_9FLAO
MQEASLQGILRTILIIMLLYYGMKLVGRILFPVFFKKMVKNFEKQANQYQNNQPQPNQKVGETIVDKVPDMKETSKSVGEYVDYEEVD